MPKDLVNTIAAQTAVLFRNARICLRTSDLDEEIHGLPVWKHLYHAFHSLDRWFINPAAYEEPPFHIAGLNSLDEPSDRVLGREMLEAYLSGIEAKIGAYLSSLTDAMLSEKPDGCPYTRLELVLGQFRHLYAHVGILNASTIRRTGKWPLVIGLESAGTPEGELFE